MVRDEAMHARVCEEIVAVLGGLGFVVEGFARDDFATERIGITTDELLARLHERSAGWPLGLALSLVSIATSVAPVAKYTARTACPSSASASRRLTGFQKQASRLDCAAARACRAGFAAQSTRD